MDISIGCDDGSVRILIPEMRSIETFFAPNASVKISENDPPATSRAVYFNTSPPVEVEALTTIIGISIVSVDNLFVRRI